MRYFAGIDVSMGGLKRVASLPGQALSGCDFALVTIEVDDEFKETPRVVHAILKNGITVKQHSAIIHQQHKHFNYDLIVMDAGGGGYATRDILREPVQDTGSETFTVRPIISADDLQLKGLGQEILVLFNRGDSTIKRLHTKIPSESFLPNNMHTLFKIALESVPVGIQFPLKWRGWEDLNLYSLEPDDMREFILTKTPQGDDKVRAVIDLALAQLVCVQRETDEMNKIHEDKFGFYKFYSDQEKDAGYALLYAYYSYWLYRQIFYKDDQDNEENSDVAISADYI